MARAVAYSPDGNYLAIGFGGRVGGRMTEEQGGGHMEGAYMVLRASDLVVSHQARDATKEIADIKFSPNGQVRVCGATARLCLLQSVVPLLLL